MITAEDRCATRNCPREYAVRLVYLADRQHPRGLQLCSVCYARYLARTRLRAIEERGR